MYEAFKADRVVAKTNQGAAKRLSWPLDPEVYQKGIRASRGKIPGSSRSARSTKPGAVPRRRRFSGAQGPHDEPHVGRDVAGGDDRDAHGRMVRQPNGSINAVCLADLLSLDGRIPL